jgi:hypothetical protein
MAFATGSEDDNRLPYDWMSDYLELVEWTGKCVVPGKLGAFPEHYRFVQAPVFANLPGQQYFPPILAPAFPHLGWPGQTGNAPGLPGGDAANH